MEAVVLGSTGIKVNKNGFGALPIQRVSTEDAVKLARKAYEAGITFFDTARFYTDSEEKLGEAFDGMREKVYIATKTAAKNADEFWEQLGISLHNLRTDYIDIYQLHNLPGKDFDRVFGPEGAYRALAEAKAEGKIGHIGATAHSVDALRLLVEDYSDRIETVMFPYNIVESQGEDLLRQARAKGIGTIAMKPLAGGNLDDWRLALRYVAASDAVDISIPGMGSVEEVERNAAAAENLSPLTAEELEQCAVIRRELGTHFCRRCGYCAPCTVGIDIPSNFLMVNYLRKYDLADWAKTRYEGLAHHAGECIECGVCESRCPYELPIRKMLKDVAAQFGY